MPENRSQLKYHLKTCLLLPAAMLLFASPSPGGLKAQSIVSVCNRSPAVRYAIQKEVGALRFKYHQGGIRQVRCGQIEAQELAGIYALFLQKSKIKHLKAGDFAGMAGLEYLDLGENKLRSLPANIFGELRSLKYLQLSNNKLRARHLDFRNMPKLQYVTLYGNQGLPVFEYYGTGRPRFDFSKDVAKHLLQEFVWAHWHLPLAVNINYSPPGKDPRLNAYRLLVEEKRAIRQLENLVAAYRRGAYDFMAVDVIFQGRGKPRVKTLAGTAKVQIFLPAFNPQKPESKYGLVGPDAVNHSIDKVFKWNWVGPWYKGRVSNEMLLDAIARDLHKLERLEHQLHVDNTRLESMIASVKKRNATGAKEDFYSPGELEFARLVQLRTLLYTHRLMNTMARWRAAYEDPAFPYPAEVRSVLLQSSYLYQAYTGWFLNSVVEHRAFQKPSHLYRVLDGPMEEWNASVDGRQGQEIPAGSVRHMLLERLDKKRNKWFARLEAENFSTLERSSFRGSPLRKELLASKATLVKHKAMAKEHAVSKWTSFSKLWSARVRSALFAPFYSIVRKISTVLGDTRLRNPAPAISPTQLREMKAKFLKPGDIILVRQEYYLSNTVIPGFWTHALLYLGPESEWTKMKLPDGQTLGDLQWIREHILPGYRKSRDEHPNAVIEAVSEGVVFSSLEHALGKDDVVILRADYKEEFREQRTALALSKALKYFGRPYDFNFDFASDVTIVCSELVYRAYNEDVNFTVQEYAPTPKPKPAVPGMHSIAGREMLSPDDIARYFLYMFEKPNGDSRLKYPGKSLKLVRIYEKLKDVNKAVHYGGARGVNRFRDTVIHE